MSASVHESQTAQWLEDSYSFTSHYNVVFTTPSGAIYVHDHCFTDDLEGAEKLVEAIDRLENFNPVQRMHWRYLRTAYGSQAWNNACEHELQKADVEAEYGEGAYTPKHPGYLSC